MGGAPPLPHDFAPQGAKNVHFLAPPRIRGQRGPRGTPPPVAEGGPGGSVGGEDPRRVSGCPPWNPVRQALGRRRRPWGDRTLPAGGLCSTPLGVDRGGNTPGVEQEGTPLGDSPVQRPSTPQSPTPLWGRDSRAR